MCLDEVKVFLGLFRGQEAVDDGVDHGQQAVRHACGPVAGMEEVIDAAVVVEIGKPGNDPVHDQTVLEFFQDFRCHGLEPARTVAEAQPSQSRTQGGEGLVVERDRPGAAQALAHGGVKGLHGIVPVPMAVGCQTRCRE